MRTYWMLAAATAALLGCTAAPGSAAPAGMAHLNGTVEQASMVNQIAYRCWWRDGERFCGRRAPLRYGYDYGRPRPEEFPTGSTAWWRAMDYEGRGGQGRR